MTLLIQISDTHFGTEQPRVMEALTRFVHEEAPQLIVVSGDITQRARRKQFTAARRFIDGLKVPAVLAIPGNHDIPLFNLAARFFSPYANYQRAFGVDLEPAFTTPQMLVLAVNTTRPYRHTDGEISPAQMERVATRLAQAHAQQLRIVITHQPVSVIRHEDRCNLVRGHAAAIKRWAETGADLILGGHIHLPYVCELGTQYTNLPRRIWAVQAGTAVSRRIRHEAGNSVNLVRYRKADPRGCIVERWDYRPALHKFALADRHELDCGPLSHDG